MSGIDACLLFDGIDRDELRNALSVMGAHPRLYGAGEIILHQSEHTDKLGIIDSGSVEAVVYGTDGTQSLVSRLSEGDVFADFLAADDSHSSPVTLMACENTRVLHIPVAAILSPPNEVEMCGKLMLSNLVRIYAKKYFELKNRIICLTQPSLRGKICTFLSLHYSGAEEITLPYNRDALARYLNADRSALSRELASMQADGLIRYRKNVFHILTKEILEN